VARSFTTSASARTFGLIGGVTADRLAADDLAPDDQERTRRTTGQLRRQLGQRVAAGHVLRPPPVRR
jgi:hypothetical protein